MTQTCIFICVTKSSTGDLWTTAVDNHLGEVDVHAIGHLLQSKNELNIMVEDIDPHIIGITKSWANKDIADAEIGLTGYVMFRRD